MRPNICGRPTLASFIVSWRNWTQPTASQQIQFLTLHKKWSIWAKAETTKQSGNSNTRHWLPLPLPSFCSPQKSDAHSVVSIHWKSSIVETFERLRAHIGLCRQSRQRTTNEDTALAVRTYLLITHRKCTRWQRLGLWLIHTEMFA